MNSIDHDLVIIVVLVFALFAGAVSLSIQSQARKLRKWVRKVEDRQVSQDQDRAAKGKKT